MTCVAQCSMTRNRRFVPGLLVCLLLAITPTETRADAKEAKRLLQLGITNYGLARFEASFEALSQARKATTDAKILARVHLYVGLNLAAKKDSRAGQAFTRALTLDPTLELDAADHRPRLVRLFQQIRESLRGNLEVRCNRAGVQVEVNGEARGSAPVTLRLPIGRHRVVVRDSRGQHSVTRQVVVGPDKNVQLWLRLNPRKARPPRRIWTWVAAGSAAVAGSVGLGFAISSNQTYSEWEEAWERHDPRIKELQSSVRRQETVANVMFGVAGALAIGAAVLYFFELPLKSESKIANSVLPKNLRLMPLAGGGPGAALGGRF